MKKTEVSKTIEKRDKPEIKKNLCMLWKMLPIIVAFKRKKKKKKENKAYANAIKRPFIV